MNRKFLESLGLEKDMIDKIMEEHGKSIKADKELLDDYESFKNDKTSLEKQLNDLSQANDGLNTKLDEMTTNYDELNNQNKELKLKDLKVNIAYKNQIPLDLANRLVGEDEETLQQDAERLAGFMAPKQPPAPLKDYESGPINPVDSAYSKLADNLITDN